MDELPDYAGPKMQALPTDALKLFVLAYAKNGGNAYQASVEAGSTGPKMYGHRALQRADVQAALDEVLVRQLKSITPAAFAAMQALIADPNHKDHAKAVFGVLDRTGFHAKSEHKTTVDHNMVADENLISAIEKLAGELGLESSRLLGRSAPQKRLAVGKVIDVGAREEPVTDIEVVADEDWLS